MIDGVPEESRDLLLDETRAFAFLTTVMKDGSPQVTPVWFDVADGLIRVNTTEGNTKCRNMKRRAGVALAIADPKDPYRYLQVRGRVERWTNEGARGHIDRLANKYLGRQSYDGPADEQRLIFFIRPGAAPGHG
ncbi:MAG: class F420-dependent oxidoreductase [Anaerolineales bacterium]|nr:class F420-dependent oxidoreductase [Anaerolineales bacterium]